MAKKKIIKRRIPRRPPPKLKPGTIGHLLMMHLPSGSHWTYNQWKEELVEAKDAAQAAGDNFVFLDRLRMIHHRWHSTTKSERTIGFLIFHYWVIKHFMALNLDKTLGDREYNNLISDAFPTLKVGVRPYSPDDFEYGGPIGNPGRPSALNQMVKTVQELATFSDTFESWHNNAHWAIGNKTDSHAMMDPMVNIYLPQFWKLHFFINNNFIGKLLGYALQEGVLSSTTSPDHWLAMSKDFIVNHIATDSPGYLGKI